MDIFCGFRKQWFWTALIGTLLILAMEGLAWAQAAPASESSSGGRNLYLASYFIVLLGIFLGLVVVCNPSRRRDRPKPESYGD